MLFVRRNGIIQHQIKRAGERLQFLRLDVVEIEAVALFVGDAAAVSPEGQLGKDRIVLLLLAVSQQLFAALPAHQEKVLRQAAVVVDTEQPGIVVQLFQCLHRCGKGHHLSGLAAGEGNLEAIGIETVHILLFAVALGGEQDGLIVQPYKGTLILARCQLMALTGFQIHRPDARVVPVFGLVCPADNKGCLFGIGTEPYIGQKMILQKFVQFDSFHNNLRSFTSFTKKLPDSRCFSPF